MSHDIRTPMNAIMGITSLIRHDAGNKDKVIEYVDKIDVSAQHLLGIINDVLDMSKIEAGKTVFSYSDFSILEFMQEIQTMFCPQTEEKHQSLVIHHENIVHEWVNSDYVHLMQIFSNLLSNAVKYTQKGGKIQFLVEECETKSSAYAKYHFAVIDNGVGMSEDFKDKIFDTFTREESSLTNKIQGTGLGMAITKNIVDMMGGNIKVKSELGKGSEITIGLRFKTTSATKNRGVIQELNGFRALVADDNMDSCVSVEKMLRTIGLRPEWTTSGKEAVFRAKYATEQNDPFHVYIIDWLMPDMNGVEVVRRIRSEIGDEVPIIILTAYDWSDIEDEAREAGVTAFCAKPLFLSELYDVLQNSSKAGGIGGNEIIAPDTFKGRKVLLVEDVELNREIAETILQEAGIHVVCVGNGQKAVEYMSQPEADDIDLILMDIMMPVMDGYEAARRIRKLADPVHANKPIIAMTANAFEEDVKAALAAGMNEHLSKPIRIELLYEIMKKYL